MLVISAGTDINDPARDILHTLFTKCRDNFAEIETYYYQLSDGDKGDITVSGAGTGTGETWTIDNDAVTNAKLANVPTSTFKGRATAGTGDPEDLTVSQAKILLDLSGTNTGDQTSVTGNAGTATALQTGRTINGVTFDGTANVTVTAAAGTLTGTTLNATVVTSSLTSVGTLAGLNVTTSGSLSSIHVTDTGASGANIKLTGNGGTTPSKTIRAYNGSLSVANSAYSVEILTLTDGGNLNVTGHVAGTWLYSSDTVNGAHLVLTGTGPNATKYIRASGGTFEVINSAYSAVIASVTNAGNLWALGTVTGSNLSGTNTGDQTIPTLTCGADAASDYTCHATSGTYATVTGWTFTAPSTGTYLVVASCMGILQTTGAQPYIALRMLINGNIAAYMPTLYGYNANELYQIPATLSWILGLNATDVITFEAANTYTGTRTYGHLTYLLLTYVRVI